MKFGEYIAMLRYNNNLTQEQLAELVNVSRQTIYKWETNKSLPLIDKIKPLTIVLNVTAEELLKYV